MSRTITGNLTTGVTLTAAGDNPIGVLGTIDTTANSFYHYALLGAGSIAWTITNLGKISSAEVGGGAGVQLNNGGTLVNGDTNVPGALVSGGGAAGVFVYSYASTDKVINYGTITGLGDGATGVALYTHTGVSGGTVINGSNNDVHALISASHNGVGVIGGAGTVANAGTITGFGSTTYASYGVFLGAGGLVTNGSASNGAALIQGGHDGVEISGGTGTVINSGTILALDSGATTDGVRLGADGTVTNGIGGSIIAGRYGIVVAGAGVVTNSGMIWSGGGYGVELDSGGSFTNTAGGSVFGLTRGVNISGVSTATIINDGTITGSLGVVLPGGGATLTNAGTIFGFGGNAVVGSLGDERLIVEPGAKFIGGVNAYTGDNVLELGAGGTKGSLRGVGTQFLNFGSIVFDAGAGWFLAGGTAGLANGETIFGFAVQDTLELTGVTATIESYNNGTLTLAGPQSLSLLLPGGFDTTSFIATPVAAGTDITLKCFAQGTHIDTTSGPVPVEALAVGDTVLSPGREAKPVVWIGYRPVDCMRHPTPNAVMPVRVRAEAFGRGQPRDDLLLSPDHAVYINGTLIPVRYLVNGTTVAQVMVSEIVYYHIELERHGVILAEGLPVESYLDLDGRASFANGGGVMRLFPDFGSAPNDAALLWDAMGCAPLTITGPKVDAARRLLAERAPAVMTRSDSVVVAAARARVVLAPEPVRTREADRRLTLSPSE